MDSIKWGGLMNILIIMPVSYTHLDVYKRQVFDTKAKKIRLATKEYIGYFDKHFCVKDNRIVYYGSDSWGHSKLMVLNMKSGKQRCLWDAIGEYENPKVKQMKIIGDYLYLSLIHI